MTSPFITAAVSLGLSAALSFTVYASPLNALRIEHNAMTDALDVHPLLQNQKPTPWSAPTPQLDEKVPLPLTLATLDAGQASSALKQSLLMRTVPSGNPLSDDTRINSAFGMRLHPIQQLLRNHRGIDLTARRGTPVFTTASGVVTQADAKGSSSYGRYVVVKHRLGFSTLYAHLKEVHVESGDRVVARQLLGLSGNTGRSNGPHLHYEIRYLDQPIDPRGFMKWTELAHDAIFGKGKNWPWTAASKRS